MVFGDPVKMEEVTKHLISLHPLPNCGQLRNGEQKERNRRTVVG